VQPADTIPGHLLSIVPIRQLPPRPVGPAPTPPAAAAAANPARARRPRMASTPSQRALIVAPPLLRPSSRQSLTLPTTLSDRYRQALEAQERLMRSWLKP